MVILHFKNFNFLYTSQSANEPKKHVYYTKIKKHYERFSLQIQNTKKKG
jgi:hypothetical protein